LQILSTKYNCGKSIVVWDKKWKRTSSSATTQIWFGWWNTIHAWWYLDLFCCR